jgi:hypothetical protein
VAGGRRRWHKHKCRSSLGPPKLHRIGGCHARSSLRASRAFRDATRSNIAPHASPSLLARRRTSLACRPWKCRLLGASGRRRLPAQGPAVARPLDRGAAATDLGTAATTSDRGTSATARRGHGAAATGWGSTTAHALGQPPSSHAASLMNRSGA